MIGFYLTIQKNLCGDIELRPELFDSFTKIDALSENILCLFSDQNASMEHFNGYTFYVIGTS